MWLLNNGAQGEAEQVAAYFREFSLFEHPGPGAIPLETGGSVRPPWSAVPRNVPTDGGSRGRRPAHRRVGPRPGPYGGTETRRADGRKADPRGAAELADQVKVTAEGGQGAHRILDKLQHTSSRKGKAVLAPDAKRIMATLTRGPQEGRPQGWWWKATPNALPTAPRPTPTGNVLGPGPGRQTGHAQGGFPPDIIVMVAGYASTRPYVPADPYDPKNRRISLLLFQETSGRGGRGGCAGSRPGKRRRPRSRSPSRRKPRPR